MSNEIVNTNTGEIMETGEKVIERNDKYEIVQLPDGKFVKKMIYKKFWSTIPETTDERIEMYKVFNDSENNGDLVTPLSTMANKEVTIHQAYTNPYESFDEKTGQNVFGVVTTLYDGSNYYATSSKSVYHTLFQIFEVFGYPNTPNYKPITVKVIGTKRERGTQINISLVGIEE